MDSRTIIAFGLMILIYIFFFQPSVQQTNQTSVSQTLVSQTPVSSNTIQPLAQAALAGPLATSQGGAVQRRAGEENGEYRNKSYWIENEKVRVEVNGLGSVSQAVFPKYEQVIGKPIPVEETFAPSHFNQALIQTSAGVPIWNTSQQNEGGLILIGKAGDLHIQRKIGLVPDSYILKFSDEFENVSKQSLKATISVKLTHPPLSESAPGSFLERIFKPQAETHEVVWNLDGSVSRKPLAGVAAVIESRGNISWTGFADKYFFFGLVPQTISATSLKIEKLKEGIVENIDFTEKVIEPGKSSEYSYALYLGPKVLPELKKAAPELAEVVDYGSWIGPIARLLLSFLHFFYSVIPNYGIGIILLTIVVKLALYPLAYKSAVSMRKLQLVQPKMKEIRDKYKEDKQRMNAEMMTLYKTEKVNPVGGCLPILLQMPVFFALYRVFYYSIEFRHSPFFGWIKDLSVYDPYFVTPVLMTALMWYQTKLTPQPPAMDESDAVQAQKAMMKWMPIIFGAIMIFLPSGLTLYFLVNALLSLVQQLYLNKHFGIKFPLAAKAN